jgi:hypothetical protein
LALLVIDDFLKQRLAYPLRHAPLNLTIDKQRIDDFATVIHGDVFENLDVS